MRKLKTASILIGLLLVLLAVLGVGPAAAALPEGITPTPTEPSGPTATPGEPTATPESPTATPTSPISPPGGGTATPTPETPPEEPPPPPRAPRPRQTEVPLLPVTGEIPPDSPFGGPFMLGILAAGILIGMFIGLGSRRFLASRFGRWISLFLSSER